MIIGSILILMINPEVVNAQGYIERNGISVNSIGQENIVPDNPEDVNEEDLNDTAASTADDGQLIYLVCQFYDNMEVMLSGLMKLQFVQIVISCLLVGAVVGIGILDHFIR